MNHEGQLKMRSLANGKFTAEGRTYITSKEMLALAGPRGKGTERESSIFHPRLPPSTAQGEGRGRAGGPDREM